ncbi:MAG: hypothetical protein KKB02_10620 [Alphaproteobacteria bacterium]|nr:hypothetical protein [Alphaproteobacteria bacterium]
MTPKELREIAAERALTIALLRTKTDMTPRAFEQLMREAKESAAYIAHVETGAEEFKTAEAVESARMSGIGKLIYAIADDENGGAVDHVKATKNLSNQARLAYARQHGLR